ncbi:hypothetical protein G3N58_18630 [Paraburkholderia sp. Ac-20342]|uniref:hypothetical protein n=1 Tax=Paraburkholderia sp. Ac-20342 TaxID=2703889 RepID=UPI00197F92D9|nr:hypothetical protein [Paraburkholderia sp. Ac-20342]MBN3848827.1 hypothetical protein [Paraburkholderia sp. Ac-20342]
MPLHPKVLIDAVAQRYAIVVDASIRTAHMTLTEAAVFHVIREEPTNVARHARADEVTAEFSRSGKTCILHIADNVQGPAQRTLSNGCHSACWKWANVCAA